MKNIIIKSLNKFGFYRHWQVRNQVILENIENIGISSNTLNYENALLPQFYQNLQLANFSPEMIFDIGAHKGDWTRQALTYYPKATYHLFEPQKQLFEHYSDLEKMPNVHLHQLGISDKKGTSQFTYVERQDSCTFTISARDAISKGYEQEMLQISSVDHFLDENDLQVPNIIKIDAEGYDEFILKGMKKTIQKYKPIFLIEYNKEYFVNVKKILKGYTPFFYDLKRNKMIKLPYIINSKKISRISKFNYLSVRNIFFLPKKNI